MEQLKQNYYGRLCTEMYEILHEQAPQDELDFYLSYAKKGDKILEALCGSFLVPFMKNGFDIVGLDLSAEMLNKLKQKAPDAKFVRADILEYSPEEKFDYIFISSGSVSYRYGLVQKNFEEVKGAFESKRKIGFCGGYDRESMR